MIDAEIIQQTPEEVQRGVSTTRVMSILGIILLALIMVFPYLVETSGSPWPGYIALMMVGAIVVLEIVEFLTGAD